MQIQLPEGHEKLLPNEATLASLFTELANARERYPQNTNLLHEFETSREHMQAWASIVTRCYYDYSAGYNEYSADCLAFYMAAIRVAVLAIRLAEEGDAKAKHYKMPAPGDICVDN